MDCRRRPQDRAAEEPRVAALARAPRRRSAGPPPARPTAAHASIASSELPSCARGSSRRRASAPARYHASTPCDSHHSPIPRTPRSEARATSTARSSPTRSRRIGRSSQSVETKPPFRPLGPCPASPDSRTTTSGRRLERLQLPGGPEAEVAAADDHDVRRSCPLRAARMARPGPPPRATTRTACAATPPRAMSLERHRGGRETSGYPASARGGGSSAGRAPGCGPGGRGFESRPPPCRPGDYPLRVRPRSSVDRAAGFEPASGGSTPPGATRLMRAQGLPGPDR